MSAQYKNHGYNIRDNEIIRHRSDDAGGAVKADNLSVLLFSFLTVFTVSLVVQLSIGRQDLGSYYLPYKNKISKDHF